MEPITYSLKGYEENSDNYYQEIEAYSYEIIHEAKHHFKHFVEAYEDFIVQTNYEIIRTEEEYLFEILMFGTFWNLYTHNAVNSSAPVVAILKVLAAVRNKNKSLKPKIDKLRGFLSSAYLTARNPNNRIKTNIENFKILIDWLFATGEFKQEAIRLTGWLKYFNQNHSLSVDEFILTSKVFAEWFALKSEIKLSKYTSGIKKFMEEKQPLYFGREDYIFTARKNEEYFLNLVGASVMNYAYREEFLTTEKKAVLLPGCMRPNNGIGCKAKQNEIDLTCTGCKKNCNINLLRKIGLNEGFEVFIIPHSANFSKWINMRGKAGKPGVVGVACALNLVGGGYELKGLNIPAQCVLLDECGCKKHWSEDGIATNINFDELLQRLNVNAYSRVSNSAA